MRASLGHRSVVVSIVVAFGLLSGSCPIPARAAETPAGHRSSASQDSLSIIVGRWAAAVGGWKRLERVSGSHLRARTVASHVPGTSQIWVTRDGYRESMAEGTDRSERVQSGPDGWVRDWNGKTRALEGRDLADGVTEAFLHSLAYAGFSMAELEGVGARDAGDDSTHAFRVVSLAPRGGVPCDLYLDRITGRPARATRKPYDDERTIAFDDWRDVAGVAMPFVVRAGDGDDEDTTVVLEATAETRRPAWRFERPADGASDVRFAHGDRAVGIPFNFENDHIMVECRVNDAKPIWFMFDTGADVTVINRSRLETLGLAGFGAGTTSGGGNTTDFSFTHVARLAVGDAEIRDQRDGVIDLAGLERVYGMPLGGILGYDFASRFVIVIDYGTHTMSLYTPGAGVSRGEKIPFVLEEGHPHVRGTITVDDGGPIAADFVIDSGAAESTNLTAPFVRANHLLERARKTPAGSPSVMSGSEKQFFAQTSVRGRLRTLALGGITLSDIPINLQQGTSGAYASASFSGTIGQRILQRFTNTFDYSRSALFLEPNAEFAKPFPPRTTFGMTLLADGPDYTTFKVTGVRKDSPAAVAGFKAGDVLLSIDGKPAAEWRLAGIRAALAEEGSQRTVRVLRDGKEEAPLSFTVHVVSIEDR